MSESMSKPWIRDYFMEVAETYGAQIHNTPISSKRKRIQLTDLLTFQENSYVWGWISDKDHRVSVRISKDAVDKYKRDHGRSVFDSRFFVISISSYRPMFSPRPLNPGGLGNTPTSHMSLEIDCVSQLGVGGHLFGSPRDLESDENMREWFLGLRQDGGGGNILKLRKQQELAQNKKTSPSHPSSHLVSLSSAFQRQPIKVVEEIAKPKPEQPQDFKRTYAKRWRIVEVDPWKFATKAAVRERSMRTELGLPSVKLHSDTASRPKSPAPLASPAPSHRTPSPTSLQRQGTPTDWSPSDRGSPVVPDEANTTILGNGAQQHAEPEDLPTISHPPSDTEGHTTLDTAIASDTRSLQPPTPAQRIKRSPMCRSSSPRLSSPEPSVFSSPHPSQQPPCSYLPPPSSFLPLPSSPLSAPMGVRKNIRRKVPHPELLASRPDPTKQGPVRVLVPNSDTSGTGSSQSYSQSQHTSQPQQYQPQLPSYSPAFPSSLATEFKPIDASTPREEKLANTPIRMSEEFAEPFPLHGNTNVDERKATSASNQYMTEKTDGNTRKQGLESDRPSVSSLPEIEVLGLGKSDAEGETERQLTHCTARMEVELGRQTGMQDTDEGAADVDHKGHQISSDNAQIHPTPQSNPSPQPSRLTAASVMQYPSPNKHDTGVPTHHSTPPSERSGSQSSMHSLFSDLLEGERTASAHVPVPVPPVVRTDDKVQERASPAPRHDPEAWKEPSFIAKSKGKGKARAVEGPDIPNVKVGKKRRWSSQSESPVPEQARAAAPDVCRAASGRTTTGKVHSNNRPSTTSLDVVETVTPFPAFHLSKPRLANFVVDFERIDLGKRVPIPRLDLEGDVKTMLLRTGRIRTLGEEVERDGIVYIMK